MKNAAPLDFAALEKELATLRATLQKEATKPEHYDALAAIAKAEDAARQQNESALKNHLKSAGKWARDVATKIGVSLAATAIGQML
ncbi:hypothetical protein CCP3SC15_530030 [Gammaproteobacteria bacterium]